jgi:hypothetical protein
MARRQQFWVYTILLLLLVIPIWVTVDVFQYFFTSGSPAIQSANDIYWGGYLFLIPALVFYFVQKQNLRFKALTVCLEANRFEKVAIATARQLEWTIVEHSDHHLVAINKWSWRSFGERITIIREGEQVLFNSVGNPDNLYSIPYAGLNQRHRLLFEEQVKEINMRWVKAANPASAIQ